MAITYGASPGTIITSFAMDETCIDQTDQTGDNTVVVSDDLSTAGNGQIGDGTNGIGNDYVGRLVIIDLGLSTEQRRRCTAAAAIGTPTVANSWLLTVAEDWDTNPVQTTDTVHVPYELADVEDGTASGGIGLGARTGLWELSNDLTVGNATDPAGLQILDGAALETDDNGAAINSYVENNGYLYTGHEGGGAPINGCVITAYNNAAGEPWMQFKSGSTAYIYDSLLWAQLVSQKLEMASGSAVTLWGSKIFSGTQELDLYDATLIDSAIGGRGTANEIVRVDSGKSSRGNNSISNVLKLDSIADTATETITLEGWIFSGVPGFVDVRQNKTWNMIDPVWEVTDYTDLTWTGTATGNELNDRRSIKTTVQEADGTLLQNALVNVYENTQLADLVLELTTDVDGYAEDSFIYKKHATNSVTTTYGGHALQCGKWLYNPFVAAQVSTNKFNGTIVLSPDNNIVQTTQATAKTAGASVTWNEDTNPSELFDFTTGSGTLAVGMIITFSPSGAVGTITQLLDGDSTAGTIHLKDRNATAIANGDTFSRTGGTAGTFSGTYTNDTKQPFSIWIDAATLSYQGLYDYEAAIQNETTLTADGELIWEWCRSSQAQPFYATGSSFYTERSNAKGIIIVNGGAGTVDYFTDDAGNTWTAPTSVTVEITVLDDSSGSPIANTARVFIADVATQTQIMGQAVNASGVASVPYSYTVDVPIYGWARELDLSGTDYVQKDFTGTITASGFSQTIRLTPI